MATVDFADLGMLTPQLPTQTPLAVGGKQPFDWDALSIALGKAGQAFSAQEPTSWQHQLGGAAAGWGQSKKMAKAAEKQGAERRANWELIKELLAGGMTPAGTPGVTSTKISGNKAGGLPELSMSITPEQEGYESLFGEAGQPLTLGNMPSTQPSQPSANKELADISPFSTSPGSVTAADLLGLTPEQIMAVSQQQADVDKLKTGTFLEAMQLLGMPFQAAKPTEQFETLYDDRGRIFTQNLTTGELKQVSGVPTEAPLTLEQRKELKKIPTDIPRGDYWKNPATDDVKWIDSGTNPPTGYTQRVPSREREVSDLGERTFTFTKERSAVTAAQNIRLNAKKEAIKPDIEFFNRNSDDAAATGFIWLTEAKKWAPDINEAVEVVLPKDKDGVQVTMADIRAEAAARKISPEEVLKEIYDWIKKQGKK